MDDSGRLHYPTRAGKDFLGLTYEETGVFDGVAQTGLRPVEGNRAERRAAKSDNRRIIPRGTRYENA